MRKASAPRSERGRQPVVATSEIAKALPLVRRALKVLSEREVTPQLGLLKSTLLQLLLRAYDVNLDGAEVCIVGRGVTVGRPLGLLLTRRSENSTVTLCHTGTRDLASHLKAADIVVAAAGVPHFIKPDMIKPGAALLDVGITRTDAGLLGDIDPACREVAGWLAPMPGGTGPLTRAMLLANVVDRAEILAS